LKFTDREKLELIVIANNVIVAMTMIETTGEIRKFERDALKEGIKLLKEIAPDIPAKKLMDSIIAGIYDETFLRIIRTFFQVFQKSILRETEE